MRTRIRDSAHGGRNAGYSVGGAGRKVGRSCGDALRAYLNPFICLYQPQNTLAYAWDARACACDCVLSARRASRAKGKLIMCSCVAGKETHTNWIMAEFICVACFRWIMKGYRIIIIIICSKQSINSAQSQHRNLMRRDTWPPNNTLGAHAINLSVRRCDDTSHILRRIVGTRRTAFDCAKPQPASVTMRTIWRGVRTVSSRVRAHPRL